MASAASPLRSDSHPKSGLRNRGRAGGTMRLTKKGAIILVVISLALIAVQAGIWAKATSHSRSETQTENRINPHHPSEIAGVSGLLLLTFTAAGLWMQRGKGLRPERERVAAAPKKRAP